MFKIVCLSALIITAIAHEWECETIPKDNFFTPMTNFSSTQFADRWYYISRTNNAYDTMSSKCAYAETHPYENGTIGLELTGINPVTGHKNNWGGLLIPRYNSLIAEYGMQFPATTDIRYHKHLIVDSDYTHYCAVIMLEHIDDNYRFGDTVQGWIASRKPTLAPKYYKRALDALRKNHVNIDTLELTKQDNCYPEEKKCNGDEHYQI